MNRRVRCARCGTEAELVHDEPGVAVQLPPGWRRVVLRTDREPALFCPKCVKAWRASDDGVEP